MNQVHSEGERVNRLRAADIRAELIFLLFARGRKKRDWRGELIVAKRLKSGNRKRRGTERKRQSESEIRVTRLGQVESAGAEHGLGKPPGGKHVPVPGNDVEVVVMRQKSRGRQSSLLHQVVMRGVGVERSAQEPGGA